MNESKMILRSLMLEQCVRQTKYTVRTIRTFQSFWGTSKVTEWSKAVSEAEKIVGYPTSFMSLRCLLSDELSNVAMQMRKLVGTKHPLLKTARKFFYDDKHSIQTRGLLVLLMSKTAGQSPDYLHSESMISGIYPRQRSLAEIIEMINTANLIHKGVVNLAEVQPSDGSVQDMHFGNKMSVLSGDFLLANASTGLAELQNTSVVELISSAIGDLVEAEFLGTRDEFGNPMLPSSNITMNDWKRHTYLTSASLIAKSCKAALMLADHSDKMQDMAFEFGKHTALAHRLSEDLHPFVSQLEDGVIPNVQATPSILYALSHADQAKKLGLLDNPNVDAGLLRSVVKDSDAVDQTKQLLNDHGEKALEALHTFTPSDARLALENIVNAVIVT